MTKETRLAWLHKLVDIEASKHNDQPSRKTPIIGDYRDGVPYRFYVLMMNKDIITVNEHGNVCMVWLHMSNELLKVDNLFDDNYNLFAYERRVDKRLGNIRDYRSKQRKGLTNS